MKKLTDKFTGTKIVYTVTIVFSIILVLLVNIVSTVVFRLYPLDIDLTGNKLFQLDSSTVEYIKNIKTPVNIQVLATEDRFTGTTVYNAQANEIMKQFVKQSDNIEISYIDYIKNPAFASNYPEFNMKHGDILVSSNGRYKHVKTQELFNYTQVQSGNLAIASSKAEQTILSAVMYVSSEDLPLVSVITGHNENDVPDFLNLLAENNYSVENIQLATQDIPQETDILLMVAPKSDFSPEELKKLDSFLNNDGKYNKNLLYFADAEQPELPNLELFLAEWGVTLSSGAVFETDEKRVYNYHPFYIIADYVNEEYAAELRSAKIPVLMPASRPMKVEFSFREKYKTEVLLEFGGSSGVRPSDADDSFTADQAVWKGPIPAMVKCDYTPGNNNSSGQQAKSTVVVSSSSLMLDKLAVGSPSFSNSEYIINLFNDISRREDVVSITPKSIAGSALNIPKENADNMGTLFIFIVPAATLALGLVSWMLRRHN